MRKSLVALALLVLACVAGVALWFNLAPPAQVAGALIGLERGRAGLVPKSAKLAAVEVAYLDGGQGEPLILLHGFGASRDNWTRMSRHLTPHFRVIAVDLPGFGDSSRPNDRHYRTRDQVETLHGLVRQLGITRFHLGGNSMGGKIAAEYAVAYPDEVKSLWLLAPGGVASAQPSEMLQSVSRGEPMPLLPRSPAEFDQLLALVMTSQPYLPGPIRHVLAQRAIADHDLHERILGETTEDWAAHPLEKSVAGLRTATRIVWGERDRLLHMSGATILRQAMPNSSMLLLPDIGHVPMLEAPEKVAEDYRAFVQAIKP
jgi:pimeloyl-ACP methyl ester carboxylesterase